MFKKILYPTDLSKGAEIAIKKFVEQNQMRIKEFIILYVVDQTIIDEVMNGYSPLYNSTEKELADIEKKLISNAKEKLEEEKKNLQQSLPADEIRTIVKIGVPYEEIVKTADEEDVSLILLPSHGKLTFSQEIFGSTTMRVLKQTKRPVLLIKANEEVKK